MELGKSAEHARWISPRMTLWSVIGLLAGFALGSALGPKAGANPLIAVLTGAGTLWVNALRMVALPLAIGNVVCAMVRDRSTQAAGRVGGAVGVYITFLLMGAALVFVVVPPALRVMHVDRVAIAALGKSAPAPAPARKSTGESRQDGGVADMITGLIPRNVLQSAVNEEFLRVLVFAMLFALALRRASPENSGAVIRFIEGTTEALMILVRWIILCSPVAMFALAATFAVTSGNVVLGIIGRFVLLECLLLLGFVAILYPLTVMAGGVPLRLFARAAAGPQMVAITTRSSLAALPALLAAGDEMLPSDPESSRMLMPLAVSIFKVNRTVSALCRLLAILYFWSVPAGPAQIITFLVTVILLSFADLGVPGGTQLRTVPAYLAAGCPLEAVMLLEVLEPFSDICKTLVNVTGDLSIAAIVTRWSRRTARDPDPVPVESAAS